MGCSRRSRRRSTRTTCFNPGNIVDAPPIDRDLRYGLSLRHDRAGDRARLAGRFRHRDRDVQRRRRLPQAGDGRHVPQLHGDARGGAQHARPRQPAARRALRPSASLRVDEPAHVRRRWSYAWRARHVNPNARRRWTWRGIKTEFLAQYYAEHPHRLRDHLFANIDPLSRLASGWRAPLANWTLSLGLTKTILDRWFGISKERTLPNFSRTPLTRGRGEGRGARGERRAPERHQQSAIRNHPSTIRP